MKLKDLSEIFALNGQWRNQRAEKAIYCTDKSMLTRDAVLRNWILPVWGEYRPQALDVRAIDAGLRGLVSGRTKRPLAGATKNRILSVLSDLFAWMQAERIVKFNPVHDVLRCCSAPVHPRKAYL